ncbi:19702_t:CDS:2, partial [Cetraspora pellucida]
MPILTSLHIDQSYHNHLLEEELYYDFIFLKCKATENYTFLNTDQHAIYNTIFILLDKIRSSCHIALVIAFLGIASLLLKGGIIAHSRFKIPFDLHKDSICNVLHSSDLAILLQQTSLILWDKALMSNHYAFKYVDRTLKDLIKALNSILEHKPFGKKVIIFREDFCQILSIVSKGRRKDIVGSLIKLTINMRLQQSLNPITLSETQEFADWLLEIGKNHVEQHINKSNYIKLPDDIYILLEHLHDLINFVYPDLNTNANNFYYIIDYIILVPKNTNVSLINST